MHRLARVSLGTGLLRPLIAGLTLLFLPASLALSGAGGTVHYLLAIAGIAMLASNPAPAKESLGPARVVTGIAGLAITANLAALLLHGLPAREFHLLPLVCVPAVMLACARHPEAEDRLFFGGALGGVMAFAVTVIEWPRNEYDPSIGTLNAIVFAQLALVCAAIALAGVAVAGSHVRRGTLLIGAGLGAIAVVASGTRGAILALPALVGVLWPHRHRWRETRRKTRVRVAALSGALLLAMLVTAWHSGLGPRLARIGEETAAYRAGEVGERSVAIRLALWRASLQIASQHPLTGVGPGRFATHLEALQARGEYPDSARIYAHPHNTPLSVLVQYGIGGLTLLIVASLIGWHGLTGAPPELRALGRALLALWWLLGFTNDVLSHQNTLRAIAFCWAVIAGLACATPATESSERRARAD